MPPNSKFLPLLVLAILGYVLLILGHGYVFGHLGTMETFPYLKELADPSLYPNDFYIEGIQSRFPDVRWIFVQILRTFNIIGPWPAFFAHLLSSLILLIGIQKVALIFTNNLTTSFWATMMTILILYNHNLGGNELYYNSLAPSLLAKSIGIWAIYFFLKNRFNWVVLILIPTTFIHPMVGIQLFIIMAGLLGISWGIRLLGFRQTPLGERFKPFPWWAILLYLLTAGTWILMLQQSFNDAPISSDELFYILFFRLGHHYFPSEYPLNDYLLLLPFLFFGWWYFWKQNLFIFWFYTLASVGLIVYFIGVELAQIPTILSAQWFKTTIWLKLFSSIALFVFIEKKVIGKNNFLRKLYTPISLIIFLSLGAFLFMKLPQRHPLTLDLPWRDAYNDRIKIALLAKATTPKDALFITPSDFTHLKYYGERSTYVDYKATIHFHSKLQEWRHRIDQIYQLPYSDINSKLQLTSQGLFLSTDNEYLKKIGITHVIRKTTGSQKGTKGFVVQAGDYYIEAL